MGQRALERRTFGTNQDTSVDRHKQIKEFYKRELAISL
jgi:hypothetical protein